MTLHQYVIARRMEQAKQLLSDTELSLGEISLQIGCSRPKSLYRALSQARLDDPKAYRDHTRR